MSHTASWLARGPMIALVIVTVLVTGGMAWAQDKPSEPTPAAAVPGAAAAPADPVKELATKTHGLFFATGADNSPAMGDAYKGVYSALNWTGVPLWAKFFFQLVFAGTAATIVSGAVAERIKFGAFYLFSFAMVGIFVLIASSIFWAIIKAVMGIRVTAEKRSRASTWVSTASAPTPISTAAPRMAR